MKIKVDFTYLLSSVFALALIMSLNGCGNTGKNNVSRGQDQNTSDPYNNNNNDNNNDNTQSNKSKFKFTKVSIAGSSITHGEGEGYLGEKSYVGNVQKYFREEVADTIGIDDLQNEDRSYSEPMSYLGQIKVYNAGKVIEGTLKASNEIAIVYAGSSVSTSIEMEIDGNIYNYDIPQGYYKPVKKLFDDTNVDFYKAFRETNEKAVKIWKLDENKEHTFRLSVKSGELHLNFITNHMYFFQNAGVSGFEASDFLRKKNDGTYTNSTIKDIINFEPDLFILESSTNDAKTWEKEILLKTDPAIDAPSTNDWIVGEDQPVGFLAYNKKIFLNQAVSVKEGDIVIMGNYNGDIQNMVVGIVASDVSNSANIQLSDIVSYKDKKVTKLNSIPSYVAKKCRIKSIKAWEERVKNIVKEVKQNVGNDMVIGIGTSGVPNYYKPATNQYSSGEYIYSPRRLLGYREKAKILAQQNGWLFVDFFAHILKIEPGVDINHKWTYGDNTHPNKQGRVYFGEAVIEAINSL